MYKIILFLLSKTIYEKIKILFESKKKIKLSQIQDKLKL